MPSQAMARMVTGWARMWRGSLVPLPVLFCNRIAALQERASSDMWNGKYRPATDKHTEHCRAVLPWWGGSSDRQARG
ncbi:hypothetical protein TSOC_009426 [Tetrabaena socialis]|uniref:Uncharacterized protein n=1 Tax=Tetrabaena socialis TaxID=47790 RepID=A0A2J7ZVW5_9CHLO|nr:hypothetical protein TSOC_009426 [Tetrabaena socialis]|eukprot:PNH04417.1 hypothetical protein TSOC_009426 [Tetrabaena socialis]